jgi:hypothetical protein
MRPTAVGASRPAGESNRANASGRSRGLVFARLLFVREARFAGRPHEPLLVSVAPFLCVI